RPCPSGVRRRFPRVRRRYRLARARAGGSRRRGDGLNGVRKRGAEACAAANLGARGTRGASARLGHGRVEPARGSATGARGQRVAPPAA
ncbi:unnamed protein product, partial [Urochloa humidicola]